jgi:hypothetical protein
MPVIRRLITVRLGSLKDMRDGGDAFIRNLVRSYYNRLSGFRRYSRYVSEIPVLTFLGPWPEPYSVKFNGDHGVGHLVFRALTSGFLC